MERRSISSRRTMQGVKSSLRLEQGWIRFALWMYHNDKSIWVYEWPMRMKAKWLVRALMAKGQQRLLRRWLRHAENLDRPEKMVQVSEPEAGRNLSNEDDMRSSKDLKECQ
jgi:hypothetical protein